LSDPKESPKFPASSSLVPKKLNSGSLLSSIPVSCISFVVQTVDFTASETTSSTFYYGIDLEKYCSAAKSEIFAGHNITPLRMIYFMFTVS
jgi:hypothetical protein